jgi:hypothetical protein
MEDNDTSKRVPASSVQNRFPGIGIFLMVIGGGTIVATMIYILNNLVDSVIYYVGIPGIILGLVVFYAGYRIAYRGVRNLKDHPRGE